MSGSRASCLTGNDIWNWIQQDLTGAERYCSYHTHENNSPMSSGTSGTATETKSPCTPACKSKMEEVLKAMAADVKKLERTIEPAQKSETHKNQQQNASGST